MRSPLFTTLLLLAASTSISHAQATVSATVLQNRSTTSTLLPKTIMSTTASPTRTTYPTSIIQTTRTETGTYPSASSGHLIDSAGGAAGTDSGSFSLSKGGLIAIIVVVVAVAVFGIASIVLFVLAKRRQWNVRASIKRASRRLTGRDPGPTPSEVAAKRKRSGVVAGSRSEKRDTGVRSAPPGHKRGLVVEVRDEERGPLDYGTPPVTTKPKENTWAGRLWGNNWK